MRDAKKHASSNSLRAKLFQLLNLPDLDVDDNPKDAEAASRTGNDSRCQDGQTDHKNDQSQQQHTDSISAHLWRSIMRGCFDIEAARRLKPLREKQSLSQLEDASPILDTSLISDYNAIPGSDDSDLFLREAQMEEAHSDIESSDPCMFSEDDGDDGDDIDWLIRDNHDTETSLYEDVDTSFASLFEDDAPFHDLDAFPDAIEAP